MVLEVLLDVLEVLLEVLDLSWRSWSCIVVGLPEEPVCEALFQDSWAPFETIKKIGTARRALSSYRDPGAGKRGKNVKNNQKTFFFLGSTFSERGVRNFVILLQGIGAPEYRRVAYNV